MCVTKVEVNGNYYDCGTCPACVQSRANMRTYNLSNVHLPNHTCYFITLSYGKEFIPFVHANELFEVINKIWKNQYYINSGKVPIQLPKLKIYRKHDIIWRVKTKSYAVRGGSKHPCIGYIDFNEFSANRLKNIIYLSHDEINKIVGVREYFYHQNGDRDFNVIKNHISVCYTQDIQNFFKRFRKHFKSKYKTQDKLYYFSAPEYGPTTSRFHNHLLLFVPKWLQASEVTDLVCASWKFCDENRLSDNVEVAICPSHYVSSYVNCSDDVSRLLHLIAPLRTSHSLGLFTDCQKFTKEFIFNEVITNRNFSHDFEYCSKSGKIVKGSVPYSKSLINSVFPFFSGMSKFDKTQIYNAYLDPAKFFALSPQVACPDLKEPRFFCSHTQMSYNNERFMASFSKPYSRYIINKINRVYEDFYKPRGYSRFQYASLVYTAYRNKIYELFRIQYEVDSGYPQHYIYYNLNDLCSGNVHNDSILNLYNKESFHYCSSPDTNCIDVNKHRKLLIQYRDNIKKRKVNYL